MIEKLDRFPTFSCTLRACKQLRASKVLTSKHGCNPFSVNHRAVERSRLTLVHSTVPAGSVKTLILRCTLEFILLLLLFIDIANALIKFECTYIYYVLITYTYLYFIYFAN